MSVIMTRQRKGSSATDEGNRGVTLDTLYKLAEAAGVRFEWLAHGEGEPFAPGKGPERKDEPAGRRAKANEKSKKEEGGWSLPVAPIKSNVEWVVASYPDRWPKELTDYYLRIHQIPPDWKPERIVEAFDEMLSVIHKHARAPLPRRKPI